MKTHRKGLLPATLALTAIIALSSTPAGSQTTTADAQCMQDRAGFSLNCTANDVNVAGVAKLADGSDDIVILDPCTQAGDSVTFMATFEVLLNAQARHDPGIYFATDGDPNGDGALTGSCSVSTLGHTPDPPWVDLDGTSDPLPGEKKPSGLQDTCGDIDDAHNPLFPSITVTAVCKDDDGDGFLDLPNCVSWRQGGANDLCRSPADTFPGSPSKCKCDAGFNVPVPVPAGVTLSKQVKATGSPDSSYAEVVTLNEPGGSVTYKVTFTVSGSERSPDVTLNELTDDVYGDITSTVGDITSTTCTLPQLIDGNSGSYSCTFTTNVSGNGGDEIPDIVTAKAADLVGNLFERTDDAKVVIADVLPAIGITKSASPTQVLEPGGSVTFSTTVTNNSTASSDSLILNSLVDDVHGNLSGQGNCSVPQTIAKGGSYSCSFTATVSGQAGYSETDTIRADATDEEGNPVNASASAVVAVNDVPSSITLSKTASPDSVAEPGADVLFTFVITNTSTVDTVTISTLTDTIYGNLSGKGTCSVPQTLGPGGSYRCAFTAYVEGNAMDIHTNEATASGQDDDGNPVSAKDTADVNFTNVPPDAALTKTVTSLLVTYLVEVYNESTAETLTLSALSDDQFGSIVEVQGSVVETTCAVPQDIAIGAKYSCTFKATVTSSPHTNTVTGTIDDDDGSTSITESDGAIVTFGEPPASP